MRQIKGHILRNLFVSILLCMGMPLLYSSEIQWEDLKSEKPDAKEIISEPEIEIYTLPSELIIKLSKSEKVEVFSILGRLVVSEILESGAHRLPLEVHGVYIIKAGDFTCKVAI